MHATHRQSESTAVTEIVIVDDHQTFTDLLRLALDRETDLDCVASACDSDGAREQIARHRPDVVVMDINLGVENGLDLTEQLLRDDPELMVVVLTAHADADVMRRAAGAGAVALLPKAGSLPDLLRAIRTARRGELFVDPGLLRSLVVEGASPLRGGTPRARLTPRESHVLQRLAEGGHVVGIARELGISVHTCRGHVKVLLSKLGAHSQLEAVVVAGRQGLVDAPRRR